jgi:hypothetical protein
MCISFVHIHHVLKIENQHINNRKKNLLENKCVTVYCSKMVFFLESISFFVQIFFLIFIGIHRIGVKLDNRTTLGW